MDEDELVSKSAQIWIVISFFSAFQAKEGEEKCLTSLRSRCTHGVKR